MAFVLQTGTVLGETDDSYQFLMRGDDLVAIKKWGTGTSRTEVHILSGGDGYQSFVLQTGTGLHETDDTWTFALRGDDLVAIKKRGTGTGMTEVHILSAGSGYQDFILQTGTALHEVDDSFDFVMRGDDLVAVKKRTGAGVTQVHVLDGGDDYRSFNLQTGTALQETDDTWAFAMRGRDLVAIQKSVTGTCTTEVHVLDGGDDYHSFNLETGTHLGQTDRTWAFGMRGNDLAAIRKSGGGTRTTEMHVVETKGYANVPSPSSLPTQEIAFGVSECIYRWRAAYWQTGMAITVLIRLNWDAGIPLSTQTTLMNTWRAGILNEWSGRFACCLESCCRENSRRPVVFNPEFVNDGAQHTVRVRIGPGQSTSSLWDTMDSGAVIAHEFGHLLGFPDEYASATCPDRNPVNTGTVMDDNAGMVQRLIQPFCDNYELRTTTL
jgi:hypothetical protein